MEKQNSAITYREMYRQAEIFAALNKSIPEIHTTLETVFAETYDELIFTGCGTSLYLAQSAAQAFASLNPVPARAVCCSELYHFPETFLKGKRTLVLPITRKSYTTEVRMAIDRARTFDGVKTLSVTCDKDAAAYNDFMVFCPEAEEESVIMTGSFTGMLYLTSLIAFHAAGRKDLIEDLRDYPSHAEAFLKRSDETAKSVLQTRPDLNLFIMLGQGVHYGVANECMNKIKEMSLSNSEAYYTMEYRHGPMSLVDGHTMIVLFPHSKTAASDLALLEQMKSFGAYTLAVGAHVSETFALADCCLDLPFPYDDIQSAAMTGFIGQFLGYHLSLLKGLDADTPRHLSQAIVLPS